MYIYICIYLYVRISIDTYVYTFICIYSKYIFIYFLTLSLFASSEFYLKNNAMIKGNLIRDNSDNILVDIDDQKKHSVAHPLRRC